MANNCLKTQLKASVNNDNLERFGYIKLGNFRRMYYQANNGGNIKIYSLDNREFYSDAECTTSIGTEPFVNERFIYAPEGFGNAFLKKYDITYPANGDINLYGASFNLEDVVNYIPLNILRSEGTVNGNLSCLNGNGSGIVKIVLVGDNNTIKGRVSDIAPVVKNKYTANDEDYILINSPYITGSFEELIAVLSRETIFTSDFTWRITFGGNNQITCGGERINGRRVNLVYTASTGTFSATIINV